MSITPESVLKKFFTVQGCLFYQDLLSIQVPNSLFNFWVPDNE